MEWADAHEGWLRFTKEAGGLAHYVPRLKGPKERRDEAFAEIAVIYFLAVECGLSVLEWEPLGANGKRGECLMGRDRREPVFVEVKAPGWEDEVTKAEGQSSPRLQQPKYIHAEARSTAPWASVRHAVKKAYPKMPDTMPTLLVINDDLVVSLLDWSPSVTDIGLYAPKSQGQTSGYLAEDGPFADARCERLGAVGVFDVRLVPTGFEYRFLLFENPHALARVKVPPHVAEAYPRYNGAPAPPARIDEGKPWFLDVLRDPEWLEDRAGKFRREAQRILAELRKNASR